MINLIPSKNFQKSVNGSEVNLITLENDNGVKCQLTNFGARVISFYAPDFEGNFEDVVVGYDNIEDFFVKGKFYFGTTVGRYGNRIANGSFKIDETTYSLATNNGPNNLHGGGEGFDRKIWETKQISKNQVVFKYLSKDMEEGFPGNLLVEVSYTLTEVNELKIEYTAETDKKTVVNLTNHTYFNLLGKSDESIIDHVLTINSDNYTKTDSNAIPVGTIDSVKNTPFDFSKPKPISQDIDSTHEQVQFGAGFDHNWVLNKTKGNDEVVFAAKVEELKTKRVLEVYTNEPGMQFYSSNYLDGTIGKNNTPMVRRGALCLETQHFPDSPNKVNFPSTMLVPGDVYKSTCIYKFSVMV